MSEDKITLDKMKHMPIGDVAKLPVDQLYTLLQQADENLKEAKKVRQWVEAAIGMKYKEQINAKRRRLGKDTGTIHIEDGNFKLSNDVPKKPEWDQEKLSTIVKNITKDGDDPEEYVDVTYKVPEKKYSAWPKSIQKVFDPARTINTGKPSYALTPVEKEAA